MLVPTTKGFLMTLRFTVLASGSAGNAAVVQTASGSVLVDGGLQPRTLLERLSSQNLAAPSIRALLLTHTHGDHWNDALLGWLADGERLLYCHPSHHGKLNGSAQFQRLLQAKLVRDYEAEKGFDLPAGLRALPIPVRHDGGATFGFRLQGPANLFGEAVVLGYAADLGVWDEALLDAFQGVDLLALEFNHDVQLQIQSPRPRFLIERVLSDHGHLSNEQAANFLRCLLKRERSPRLTTLVQLHLSKECNRPELAQQAAQQVVAELQTPLQIHTARQERAMPLMDLTRRPRARTKRPRKGSSQTAQPFLPGLLNEPS
jgi:glyoxylase-like metal-dependent hydrolase (beta-lactamase superfamily II)